MEECVSFLAWLPVEVQHGAILAAFVAVVRHYTKSLNGHGKPPPDQ